MEQDHLWKATLGQLELRVSQGNFLAWFRETNIKEIKSVDISFTTKDPDQTGDIVSTKYYEIIRPDNLNVTLTFE